MSIQLAGVSYRYAGSASPALTDCDLQIESGRVLGLIGPNAAGKSTLCLVAVGLAPGVIGGSLEGSVTVDGLDAREAPAHELAQRAGILFQEPYNQLSGSTPTVWEEVALGPRNLGLPLDEVVDRTWSAIDALGIGPIAEREPTRLSGGQAQLVALASVLALRPAYLLLDEPTSELDPLGTRMVGEALQQVAESTGAGILIVEHKTDLIAELCWEVAVLAEGRLVAKGPAPRVLGDDRLEQWGITPPAPVRLRRLAERSRVHWDPAWA